MKLKLLQFSCCSSALVLGFQEVRIVIQTLTLLSAATRVLRLHLVLERLLFSTSLLPRYIWKKKILVLENGITLNREMNFDAVNILYKSYKGWLWASSLSDHSGSTDCLYGSTLGFPFALASPQTSGTFSLFF